MLVSFDSDCNWPDALLSAESRQLTDMLKQSWLGACLVNSILQIQNLIIAYAYLFIFIGSPCLCNLMQGQLPDGLQQRAYQHGRLYPRHR